MTFWSLYSDYNYNSFIQLSLRQSSRYAKSFKEPVIIVKLSECWLFQVCDCKYFLSLSLSIIILLVSNRRRGVLLSFFFSFAADFCCKMLCRNSHCNCIDVLLFFKYFLKIFDKLKLNDYDTMPK